MKRPSFQMYQGDWLSNAKLRRCSFALRGVWIDAICLMSDSDEHGVLRWPLQELANAVGCPVRALKELREKGVLKGADIGERMQELTYTPRHAGKAGDPVTLLPAQDGPIWYSSRMVRDEYIRTKRATQGGTEGTQKQALGDHLSRAQARAPAQSSSASSSPSVEKPDKPTVGLPPDDALAGETPKAKARRDARAAGERAIAYLNAKAGTRYQPTEANLRFPIGRILYDGASETDLLAVVDLKFAEAAKGEFDRKYLRPATLWNAEKFSQYSGQVGMNATAAARSSTPIELVNVHLQSIDSASKRCLVTHRASGKVDPWDLVKRIGSNPSYRRELIEHKGYVVVEVDRGDRGTEVLGRYSSREIDEGLRA